MQPFLEKISESDEIRPCFSRREINNVALKIVLRALEINRPKTCILIEVLRKFASQLTGADPGFRKRGFIIIIKVWGFALLYRFV